MLIAVDVKSHYCCYEPIVACRLPDSYFCGLSRHIIVTLPVPENNTFITHFEILRITKIFR